VRVKANFDENSSSWPGEDHRVLTEAVCRLAVDMHDLAGSNLQPGSYRSGAKSVEPVPEAARAVPNFIRVRGTITSWSVWQILFCAEEVGLDVSHHLRRPSCQSNRL
jgi:hypothetical protein